jgi:hypothetical protein
MSVITKQWVVRIGDDHYVDLNSVGGGYVLTFLFINVCCFYVWFVPAGQ